MLKSTIFLLIITSSIYASDGVVNVNKQSGTYTVGAEKPKKVKRDLSEMEGIMPLPSPKGMNGMMPK